MMQIQSFCNLSWMWFCIAFGLALLTTILMSRYSRNFYTKDPNIKRFSIMDLEWPVSSKEIVNIISGIFKLEPAASQKAVKALRTQLLIDFIFMPAIYGSVFFLCMQVSCKMMHFGRGAFAILAWLQLVPWLCDVIENIYLLSIIKPAPSELSKAGFNTYRALEIIKWGLSLIAGICALASIFYFWVTGGYSITSLQYLLITIAEIILFFVIMIMLNKSKKKEAY